MSSKGYTSSFRGSVAPGAYFEILASDFGTIPGSSNPQLGSAGNYSLLAYAGITNTGNSVINGGNIGSAPTMSIVGFPPGVVVPPYGIDNADAAAARIAGLAAYTFLNGLTSTPIAASFGTTTFTATPTGFNGGPGFVGAATSTLLFSGGTVTLDGAGLVNPTFVFQVPSALNVTTAATTIALINGAKADNVYWLSGSSVTFDAHNHVWSGNILANTSITLNSISIMTLAGRALAVGPGNGAVTISNTSNVSAPVAPFVPGLQNPLPLIPAGSTADFVAVVANTGSQWKVQKSVKFARPDGTTETVGIVVDGIDCISPVYPGTSTVVAAGFTPASYMALNGYLFVATTGGTTAATFIGFSKFNTTKGAATTDGTVVWTSLGKAAIVRIRFANVGVAAATPVKQEWDVWEN